MKTKSDSVEVTVTVTWSVKLQKENQTDHRSPNASCYKRRLKIEKYESEWKKKKKRKIVIRVAWSGLWGVVERKTANVTWLVAEPVSEAMIGRHVVNKFWIREGMGGKELRWWEILFTLSVLRGEWDLLFGCLAYYVHVIICY